MAELSDQLMVVTVLAYLAAMVCHAAEYAFGDRGHIGRAASRPARQLVGARAPTDTGPDDASPVASPLAAADGPGRVGLGRPRRRGDLRAGRGGASRDAGHP